MTECLTAPNIAIILIKDNADKDLEQALSNSICHIIRHMLGYFNAKNSMNDTQIWAFSHDFIRKHPMDSLEDLVMCLRNARTGQYGTDYNRIDGMKLFLWYERYLEDDKTPLVDYLNHNKKHQTIDVDPKITARIKESLEKTVEKEQSPQKKVDQAETLDSKIEQFVMYSKHYTDVEVEKMYLSIEYQGRMYHRHDPDGPKHQYTHFDELLWVIMEEINKRLD